LRTQADLSAAEARRLALASLGFGVKKPSCAGQVHVRATAARLGAIQIDSVNVLARAHYLPTFSRYGPYPLSAVDDLAHGKRELFEYWGHAACLLPNDLYPLMRWRMDNQIDGWAGLGRSSGTSTRRSSRSRRARPISAGEISMAGKSTGRGGAGRGSAPSSSCSGRAAWRSPAAATSSACHDIPARVPGSGVASPCGRADRREEGAHRPAARAMGVGTAKDSSTSTSTPGGIVCR
jgi:hypothetical protein